MSIAIVDYSAGNLTSVKKALDRVGASSFITSDSAPLAKADKIVIPGVGHFGATLTLSQNGLRDAIICAIAAEKPVLGICLGMQWLFRSSLEAPGVEGLGIFPNACNCFPENVKSPHVGWNALEFCRPSVILRDIPDHTFVYFTHSYRAPVVSQTVATCEYAGAFSAAVECGRLFGVQFHPEKSATIGLQLLSNFCNLPC
jgi:imidazole glycerol-phosphate synthase subunit HisH